MTDDPRIQRDHLLLQQSLNLVAPVAGEFIAAFYDRLFTAHPELRSMFPEDMTQQRERLLKAIIALVIHFDRPEQLQPALIAMGRAHVRHGVGLAHYAIVGDTLLATLREFAGPAWSAEYAAAWERAYTFAAGTMMAAAAASPSLAFSSLSDPNDPAPNGSRQNGPRQSTPRQAGLRRNGLRQVA